MMAMMVVTAMLAAAPRVAILPADGNSGVSVTLIQSKLDKVRVIDRKMLSTYEREAALSGKALADIGVDYLVLVRTAILPAKTPLWAQIMYEYIRFYEVTTIIEVVDPPTAEILKTIVLTTRAPGADVDAGLAISGQVVLLEKSKEKSKPIKDGVTYAANELYKVFGVAAPEPDDAPRKK